ncbi:thiamine pyrophosphate-dependent dehydrogenase E1 component subunit alpha [Pseudofrankia asymbiotica]|uniref:Pyruvate dehydrogenase (Acetyl-transferring) E1 component subunit alpha n=1 Tax=Pseudofrankia asymbiotica TaxID=1834516 RepID=A0A1V2I7H7_9ACTN|nr:pyruvate dehydrogenase (acetyl-transferring) E1 component subunit alpha [Pseudofrankia asymbiotica]
MYRRMLRIRLFEESAQALKTEGVIPGSIHLSIGQEAEIVGACMAVERRDYMLGNHRSHGHPIGKGAALAPLMAELLGRRTGVNQGKGGSMHLADFSVGSLGESSIVGSGIPVAAGAALAAQLRGEDRVCLCFFGDGASNEGMFHEGLNLAAIWHLPVIYLCENNGYGATTSAREVVAVTDIADRAAGYGIPGEIVDGQDVVAVHEVVTRAVERARRGEGPTLVEAKTYRYDNHAFGLHIENYRTTEEREQWLRRDPIPLLRDRLVADGVLSDDAAKTVEDEARAEVAAAVDFARTSPFPEPAEAFDHLFTVPLPARTAG